MDELVAKIRDYICRSDVEANLWQDMPLYNQICSSLDVIGDAQYGIEAYLNRGCGETEGARYIAVYGLFQALILQQDAVFHLCQALGHPEQKTYPDLEAIREIRNRSTGHPTKKDRPPTEPTSYHYIGRSSLRYEGFQLLVCDGVKEGVFKEIKVLPLIEQQQRVLKEVLATLISKLPHRGSIATHGP